MHSKKYEQLHVWMGYHKGVDHDDVLSILTHKV